MYDLYDKLKLLSDEIGRFNSTISRYHRKDNIMNRKIQKAKNLYEERVIKRLFT